ncbi:MAG: hypothetical protein ACPGID_09430 [Rubricella sp.]
MQDSDPDTRRIVISSGAFTFTIEGYDDPGPIIEVLSRAISPLSRPDRLPDARALAEMLGTGDTVEASGEAITIRPKPRLNLFARRGAATLDHDSYHDNPAPDDLAELLQTENREIAEALERAMTAQVAVERPTVDPALLPLADYAAPRRPRGAEDAIQITGAYLQLIMGREGFTENEVLSMADDVVLRQGPATFEEKRDAFASRVDTGAFEATGDGRFRLSEALALRYSR